MSRPSESRRRVRLIGALVLGTAAVALAVPAAASPDQLPSRPIAGPAAAWPLKPLSARLVQQGSDLMLDAVTSGTISAGAISAERGRSLCVELLRARRGLAVRRICLVARNGRAALVRQELSDAGQPRNTTAVAARLTHPKANRIVAIFPIESAGLGLGPYRWQVRTVWRDSVGCSALACIGLAPVRPAAAKITVPRLVGCRATGPAMRSSGPRDRRMVAISFDDGPSPYTEAILASLKRHRAHATFFQVGNQMGGRAALQRRILAEGHSIGDHSWSHPVLSGGGAFAASEVSRTKERIRANTGFTPCLFRAPYGAVSGGLIKLVRDRGMLTIQWDVDPTDWAKPGTGAIISRVLRQARRGSIILMHDGGGNRSQSVAAAEAILASFERQGVKVVSVETLLGLERIYR